MQAILSDHGRIRMQQRSIPERVVDLLQEFGSTSRSHGADRYFLDQTAKRRLIAKLGRSLGPWMFQQYRKYYAVVSDDGKLITASRRTRRFKRDA